MHFADMIIKNGNIITLSEGTPSANALAIKDGRIMMVGSDKDLDSITGAHTHIIDAAGGTVIPGLHDGHLHFIGYGLTLQMVPLAGVDSIEELVMRVSQRVQDTPANEWVTGSGWDHNLFKENRYPNRYDLDQAAPNHPVVLTRICGHLQAVNSKALELAGVNANTPDPAGGHIDRDENGIPTGIMRETATRLIMNAVPPPSYERLSSALRLAVKKAHACGLTSITTDDIRRDRVQNIQDNIQLYRDLLDQNEPTVRVTLELRDLVIDDILKRQLTTGNGDEWLKIGNLKIFQDGALGAKTAVMRHGYDGESDVKGIPIHTQEELDLLVKMGHDAGLQVAIHAIGDGAIDSCLDAFEKAMTGFPRPSLRHRIIHYCLIDQGILQRTKDLGVTVDIQPPFVPLNGQWVERLLGKERSMRTYSWKTILDYGIPCVGSSDCPITPIEPLVGIWAAVTRHAYYTNDSGIFMPQEVISAEDALRLYTLGSAYGDFDENNKGSLEVGKFADVVILGEDLCKVDPNRIKDISVEMTIVGGRIVYDKKTGVGVF